MAKQWYVVHTYSGHENKVKMKLEGFIAEKGLQERISQIIIPMENVAEVKEGKRVTTARKCFPGYILLETDLDEITWKEIWSEIRRSISGITGFLGNVRPEEFQQIKELMEDKGEKPKARQKFQIGDMVRVIEGRNIDLVGKVEEVDEEKGKLKIAISILGRTVSTDVDILQVERVV
ncbi:MAG: transcription termination/antitermination protein NusG [bacterium]|nr:transcription termination/antitermination protein NusG [bacterium]